MVVSVRDVAAAASVSVGTVSNVLNRPEKVSPATVERVTQAIEELGFVRNDAARQLRAGRSRSIALIVLDAGNPFFAEVARGAEDRAAEAGMSVLLGNSDERSDREDAYVELFREQRVNGVLVTPVDDLGRLERLRTGGVPVVLVDHEDSERAFGSVSVDDVEGGYLAVSHLLSTGRRRIAFIGGPRTIRQVADRLEGARRAIAEVRRGDARGHRDVDAVGAAGARGRRVAARPERRPIGPMRCSRPTTCSRSARCRPSRSWQTCRCRATSR